MNDITILFLLIYYYYLKYVNATTILNAIGYRPVAETPMISYITNLFNEYSKANDLDIIINLNLITTENSTRSVDNYYSFIDSILGKKSKKYDIIFYNCAYTPKYEPHFLNLKEYLPKEHIQMYNNIENSELYTYNNKLIGFPIYIYHSVMHNNVKLLKKYNKKIPETWNELLETGKYIFEQEKKNNNTEILIYNGSFAYDEVGMSSIYEFMYSYRNSIGDPFPDLRSENAVNALKMMKTLKKEVSSDKYYQDLIYTLQKLDDGNGLFIKENYIKMPINEAYKSTVLPGYKKGISGTFIGGDNIGINKYIDTKRKEASIKALMYLTSKELQRKLTMEYNTFTGISSLYEEEEICNKGNICEIYKNLQPVEKPISKTNNYHEYSEKFRQYIYEYLYGDDNVDPANVLKKIDDITRIYYISLDSYEGRIIGIICITLSFIIFSSSIFLFIEKFQNVFCFLSKRFWILSLLGYILLISVIFVDLVRVTIVRCYIKLLLQLLGFTFIFIPIFHKLISNFPETNKFSYWVSCHPNLFAMAYISVDLVFFALMFIQPYRVENIIVSDGKNFQKCKEGGIFSLIVVVISLIIKASTYIISILLLFLEWNLKSTYYDIRICSSVYFIDGIFIIIILIFYVFNVDQYSAYFLIREITTLFIVISSFVLLFIIRLFYFKASGWYIDDYSMEKFPQDSILTTSSYLRRFSYDSESNNSSHNSSSNKFKNSYRKYFRILEYHFRNEIMSSKNYKDNIQLPSSSIHNNGIQSLRNYNPRVSLSRNCYNNNNMQSSLSYNDIVILVKVNEVSSQNNITTNDISSSYDFSSNDLSFNNLSTNDSLSTETDVSQLRNALIYNNSIISSSSNTLLVDDTHTPSNNNSILSKEDLTLLVQNQIDITNPLIKNQNSNFN